MLLKRQRFQTRVNNLADDVNAIKPYSRSKTCILETIEVIDEIRHQLDDSFALFYLNASNVGCKIACWVLVHF